MKDLVTLSYQNLILESLLSSLSGQTLYKANPVRFDDKAFRASFAFSAALRLWKYNKHV
jgi:hypothetical protein